MSILESSVLAYVLAVFAVPTWSAYPTKLKYPHPVTTNKITGVNLSCDSKRMNITLTTKQPFRGIAFAKDFAQECKSFGSSANKISLSLSTSSCGVRLTTSTDENGASRMVYSVGLIIQQDKLLRQITDQEKSVQCLLEDEAFVVKSQPMFIALKKDAKSKNVHHRIGRLMKEGWSKDLDENQLEEELQEAMSAARAWMEIVPEKREERLSGTVEVGEWVLLSVKSTLPAGIGWKLVNCVAHDGLGDSFQKLLDEEGCPLEESLLPPLKYGPVRPIASMRHQEATARFAAFKFPDRDRLHFKCQLQVCRATCGKTNCNDPSDTSEKRAGRSNYKDHGQVLDHLEVFNSMEVIAPDIDDANDFREKMKSSEFETYPFPQIPGDRAFCISPNKIAIAFCALGLVFLLAVVITACSLLKTRRSHGTFPYYTRSLFSSSSGAGSAFGSKLLLQDSPILGQSSSSSMARMHYGRII
ncbi:cuticlin-5 [Cylas formicarius]|uniref:cuticlin-5 n=1 Tax=Cylas formicarius TaxID=197179 RepID=UPI002958867E|nr:cuticlin-5 [Cylas formicarius]XP_060531480.1 cuticlin-5 [Cylas formicarius]